MNLVSFRRPCAKEPISARLRCYEFFARISWMMMVRAFRKRLTVPVVVMRIAFIVHYAVATS